MYLEYFDLRERPFSITPDPRFLYMSARHREALAHLLYGLGESGGFVQLTGEVGTGKTTVCRCLLEQVPDNVDVAMVLNPKVTADELIATVCDELGIEYPQGASIKTLIDILNGYLLDAYARGRRTVLIIDEAQNLSADVLEQVRLLTNLETATQKLLQIVLIGQPELRDLLAREEMRQLSQRVTARYHLEPITREETDAYIRHRLQICGCSKRLFSRRAVDGIQHLSGGIPRLINVLCDRALLGAYVEGKTQVDTVVMRKAAREVLAEESGSKVTGRYLPLLAGALVASLLAAVLLVWLWPRGDGLQDDNAFVADVPATADAPAAGQSGAAVVVRSAKPLLDPPDVLRPDMAAHAGAGPVVADDPAGAAGIADNTAGDSQPSLEELLGEADSTWYRATWRELLARWSVALPDSVKPDFCGHARQYGLRCLIEQGSWTTLRTYNRPAMLKLVAGDGRRIPVFLNRIDGDVAELVLGTTLYRLPVSTVEQHWFGEFTLLYQVPPGGRMFLKAGSRAEDVDWLRRQLETIQGIEIPAADRNLFDFALHKQVLEFQRQRNLLADGVIGKNTLIQLNTLSGRPGVPRLLAEQAG